MSKPDELQTIDTAALAQVSGGVAQVPPTTADPVLTALTGILDSLKTLSQQGSSSPGLNQQEMLMFMMMMQQRNQQAAAAAASAGAWWNQQPIVRYY
jgi:hypothetical protein